MASRSVSGAARVEASSGSSRGRPPRQTWAHSQAMTPAITRSSRSLRGGPATTTSNTSGARISAVIRRRFRECRPAVRLPSGCRGKGAKSTVPTSELGNGSLQILALEVGPEPIAEDQLRVGQLPEQEVADPHLSAGADEQVRIRQAGGFQPAGERRLIDAGGVEFASRGLLGQPPGARDDLLPSPVGEGDRQLKALVPGARLLEALDDAHQIGRQTAAVADHAHPNVKARHLRRIVVAEIPPQQPHQIDDLGDRPLPVFRGKGKKRQAGELEINGGAYDAPRCFRPPPVPDAPGKPTTRRPTSVAVHNDRDVARHADLPCARHPASDLHDLGFFLSQRLVYELDVLVGQLL